jgi:major vault protein
VTGNKVGDAIDVESSDLVKAKLTVKYRVNFEGDSERFFQVDDYVKLLCDHARSKLKAALSKATIHDIRANLAERVRDAILGTKTDETDRLGLSFEENGMRVYDVEVLDLKVADGEISGFLDDAEVEAVRQSIRLSKKEAQLHQHLRMQEIERKLLEETQKTEFLRLELKSRQDEQVHLADAERQKQRVALEEMIQAARLAESTRETEIQTQRLNMIRAEHEEEVRKKEAMQGLAMAALQAKVEGTVTQAQAFSPQLVAALNRLGDEQMLAALSENFGEIAAIEGKGLLETAKKFLDFVPSSMVPTLKNGESKAG